ncbi:integrin [Alloalcanivorax profundimaris]|uniref:integrin n=1 Tax=Alloalcanivorax profundimaris TaxID=2735259 RepID=UPI001890E5A7|nr:integrin [Alloalcanivorax profundimaris]
MNSCRRTENNRMNPASPACWHRVVHRILLAGLFALGLAACGGGGGNGIGNGGGGSGERGPFTAASVTVGSEPKHIQLNWVFDDGMPDHYTVEVNPDGNSGFTQVDLNGDGTIDNLDEIAGSQSSVVISLPLHLTDFNNGRYRIVAYDDLGAEMGASTSINLISVVVDRMIGYVKASNTDSDDRFGGSVALSADGNTLVVGARAEASKATGVDGDEADNSEAEAGAVYVFNRDPITGVWTQQAYLKASNAEAGDEFGARLALARDGNTLAVGAITESSNARGIDGDQNDNSEAGAGAVYVFTRTGTNWTQQAYIKASNTEAGDRFGQSVSLANEGNTLAVAGYDDSNATTIGGDESDNSEDGAGAVYIFTRTATGWAQQTYIKASNAEADDHFGYSTALARDGNTLAVGSTSESSSAKGIGGDESNNSAAKSGAVYIFARTGATWAQQAYIKASNAEAGDIFGSGVSLADDGNTLAVGAYQEGSQATGVGGDEDDNSADRAGAAYVFKRSGSTWMQEAYIKASNAESGDAFGTSIALAGDGNILAVGAYLEEGKATGIGGDEHDDSVGFSLGGTGSAYVFARNAGTTWKQQAYVKSSNTDVNDYFGVSVALAADGNTLAAGAFGESSRAAGVNGDQSDNSADDAGAVYLY